MEDKVPMTQQGYLKLQDELKKLKFQDRPSILAAIEEARGHGDLSENAEYHAAREQQSFTEGRIMELESALSRAQVIDTTKLSGDKVVFGATVHVSDLDTFDKHKYQVVGHYEADLEAGRLSNQSPLAKALIGKKLGDIIEVDTPKGTKSYEILTIDYV